MDKNIIEEAIKIAENTTWDIARDELLFPDDINSLSQCEIDD